MAAPDDVLDRLRDLLYPSRTPEEERAAEWEKLHKAVEMYDQDMLARWTNNLNNMLVFVGLFSAVVTAFIIDSYKWLQGDPDGSLPQVATSQVAINALWFLSLASALVSALLAILVLQWLQEYPNPGHVSTGRAGVRLRQMRYESLQAWGIPDIVSILPVLLQISLVLFATGVLILLWTLNHTVAKVVTTSLVFPVFFVATTVILPMLRPTCAYKSPVSTTVFMMWNLAKIFVLNVSSLILSIVGSFSYALAVLLESPGHIIMPLYRAETWNGGYATEFTANHIIPIKSFVLKKERTCYSDLRSRREFTQRDVSEVRRVKIQRLRLLDGSALSWGQHALDSKSLMGLEKCLDDLDTHHAKVKCVLAWTGFMLRVRDWNPRSGSFDVDRIFAKHQSFVVDAGTVEQLRRLLLKVLLVDPETEAEDGWELWYPRAVESLLLVLRQLFKKGVMPEVDLAQLDGYHSALRILLRSSARLKLHSDGWRNVARCIFEGAMNFSDPRSLDQVTREILDCVAQRSPSMRHDIEARFDLDTTLCFTAFIVKQNTYRSDFFDSILPDHKRRVHDLIKHLHVCIDDTARIKLSEDVLLDSGEEAVTINVSVWPALCNALLELSKKDRSLLPSDEIMRGLISNLLRMFRSNRHNEGLTGGEAATLDLCEHLRLSPDEDPQCTRLELGTFLKALRFLSPIPTPQSAVVHAIRAWVSAKREARTKAVFYRQELRRLRRDEVEQLDSQHAQLRAAYGNGAGSGHFLP